MAASMPIGAALIGIDQSATVRSIATPRPLACQAMITAPIAMTASLIATRMGATNIREHGRAHGPGKTDGPIGATTPAVRKGGGQGKGEAVRVMFGGWRLIQKKNDILK